MTGARVLLVIFVLVLSLAGALCLQLVAFVASADAPSADAVIGFVVGVMVAAMVAGLIGTLTDD